MTLLVVQDLRAAPGSDGITFEVAPGEIVAITGAPGSGKSMLLRLIGGQRRPASGRIRLGDDDVTRATPRELFRLGVGQMPERPGGFASLSVRENVQLAILSTRGETASWWRPARRRHRARADLLLDRVGLLPEADRALPDLSGASRRRLDLALALANRPRLLLLDDPLAALDSSARATVLDIVQRLARDEDTGLLLAVSDPNEIADLADRTLVLEAGAIVARHEPAGSRSRRGFA